MSTLERGNEIEADFYQLKAQEWACEPWEARRCIVAALKDVRDSFQKRRSKDSEYQKQVSVINTGKV